MASTTGVRKLAGKVVVRVYLLDNSMRTVLVEEEATANEVCAMLGEQIGFDTPAIMHCFSLHECLDGVTIGPPIPESSTVLSYMEGWGSNESARFVFTCKLFMDSIRNHSDPKVQYMLYIQAVYSVICGIYPVSQDEAVELAALQVIQRIGPFKADVHKPGFLTSQLIGFVPSGLLPKRSAAQWETDIFAKMADLAVDQAAAPKKYCDVLSGRDYYGCSFYGVSHSFSKKIPKTLIIGINCTGIYLLDQTTKMTLAKYTLAEIYRWGFQPKTTFYFEQKKNGGAGPVYEFRTVQGEDMSNLLTDYAMALLKEMGVADSDKGAAEGGTEDTKEDTADGAVAHAATKMQAMFRGYRLRRDLEYDYAAVRIQSVFRGYTERCRFDAMIARMEAELEAAEAAEAAATHDPSAADASTVNAAVLVQSSWRGYQERAALHALEEDLAAETIQSRFKGHAVRKAL